MELKKLEKELLLILYQTSNHKLSAFILFSKMRISVNEFTKLIQTLIEKTFIYEKETNVFSLTNAAKDWIISANNKVISIDSSWKDIPEDMHNKKKLEIDDFYIPSIKLFR